MRVGDGLTPKNAKYPSQIGAYGLKTAFSDLVAISGGEFFDQ